MAIDLSDSSAAPSAGEGREWEKKVDDLTNESNAFEPVVDFLVSITLPQEPWAVGQGSINPMRGDLEIQSWPWNRAASNFLARERPFEALEVWSAMYLTFLSLQSQYHQRYDKATALCNIGYALGKIKGRRKWQAKSWLLGIIEDALTDPETSVDQLSFRNLLSMKGATRSVLLQLVATVRAQFVHQSMVAVVPEACVEIWLEPTRPSLSQACLQRLQERRRALDEAYPGLPGRRSYWALLQETWDFADWSKGVIGD